jgi:hypothetical protein
MQEFDVDSILNLFLVYMDYLMHQNDSKGKLKGKGIFQ